MYVIPTIHPAALLRSPVMGIAVRSDLRKAVRVAREGPSILPVARPHSALFPTSDDVAAFFDEFDRKPLVLDCEATLRGELVCIGMQPFDNLEHQGLLIPFLLQGGAPYWRDVTKVMQLLLRMLGDEAWPKLGQNFVGYDAPLLERSLMCKVRGVVFDTMSAHATAWAELPHGLAFMSSMWTDLGPYKLDVHVSEAGEIDFENILDIPSEQLYSYCLDDCFATAVAARRLMEDLDEISAP